MDDGHEGGWDEGEGDAGSGKGEGDALTLNP
jgi:hypothetical protein